MKKLLSIVFLASAFTAFAQESSTYHIGAGLTVNNAKGFEASIIDKAGYFVSVTTAKKLTGITGFSGSLTYMNQHLKFKNVNYNINSINATFAYCVYPFSEGFYLAPGFSIGYHINATRSTSDADQDIPGLSIGLFMWSAVAGYDLNRVTITASFGKPLSDSFFSDTITAGIHYKF